MTPAAPAPVSYDLSTRVALQGRQHIVLELFREGRVILNKVIATVDDGEIAAVLERCRRHMAGRGLEQVEIYDLTQVPAFKRAAGF